MKTDVKLEEDSCRCVFRGSLYNFVVLAYCNGGIVMENREKTVYPPPKRGEDKQKS